MENSTSDKILYSLSGGAFAGTPEERHSSIVQNAKEQALGADGTELSYEDYIGHYHTSETVLWGERLRQAIAEAMDKVQTEYAIARNLPVEQFNPGVCSDYYSYEKDNAKTSPHFAWQMAIEWGTDA